MTSSVTRPNCSGHMQNIGTGEHVPFASMLPVIDLNPNDESCIFDTVI